MVKKLFAWVKKGVFVLWLCVIALLGAWIATDNAQPFALSLFVFSLPELSIGVYLCLVFAVGVVLGFLTSYLAMQSKIYFKNRALKKANKEVGRLKSNVPQVSVESR